jgi:hypothetical protein
MKKKIEYTDGPIGKTKVVKDFLPRPEELALKGDNIKVTISLSKKSVDFFKNQAKRNKTGYQTMIKELLDVYANKYEST